MRKISERGDINTMDVYYYPIHEAMLHFPMIAILLTIPYMLWQYHRLGAVSFLESLFLFSFFFYMLCAYYLVILPLPDIASVAGKTGPFAQLVPFHFVVEFLQNTVLKIRDIGTYLGALKQGVFLQPLFNFLLTVPFGVFLGFFFQAGWKKTLLFSFLLSLFFELTQLTGLYGIYPKPYRLFDVDDLMLNTLGGMLGWRLGHHLRFLPTKKELEVHSRERGLTVSYTRRLLADMVDMVCLTACCILLSFLLSTTSLWMELLYFLLYFVGLGTLFRGKTPGKALVRIRMEGTGKHPLPIALFIKYGVLLLPQLALLPPLLPILLSELGVYLAVFLYTAVDWLRSFSRDRRLWYERLSGTKNVNNIPWKSSGAISREREE